MRALAITALFVGLLVCIWAAEKDRQERKEDRS